ncbi:Oidioi.mRNA.OKI2018_I69.chr2.g5598.t1.cds [Oikopleura dioica]|uniref:Oidioi.mRNA.OKI2018_I69.chr2.g5598.t1.cds n=1 Tax=Oikopleura dioica TaxID=34765 RepID=A0ABN7T1B1_OIKDI|nr:Oidioi.mRNA.OKI2018_I69.chr2.g5598.t1.cds [Oikopleura dioica]
MKVFIAILAVVAAQKKDWFSRCVKPTNFDLDLSRYDGTWFEQHRYPVSFEPEAATCVRAQYTLEGNAVRVNNSMINEDPKSGQKVLSWALGRATVPNEEKNNKLIVVFDKIPSIGQWFINKLGPNYWVMDTDYDNYAIVMSCSNYGLFTSTYFWLLARDPNFRSTSAYIDIMDNVTTNFKVKNSALITIDANSCDYDAIVEF